MSASVAETSPSHNNERLRAKTTKAPQQMPSGSPRKLILAGLAYQNNITPLLEQFRFWNVFQQDRESVHDNLGQLLVFQSRQNPKLLWEGAWPHILQAKRGAKLRLTLGLLQGKDASGSWVFDPRESFGSPTGNNTTSGESWSTNNQWLASSTPCVPKLSKPGER